MLYFVLKTGTKNMEGKLAGAFKIPPTKANIDFQINRWSFT